MTLTKNRIYIGIAIAAGVLLVGWLIFRESPVTVETAEATRGQLAVTIDGEGKTRFRDKFTVAAPVSGKMSRIQLREGDLVPKEYVITEIDPNPPTTRPPSETENRPNPYAQKVYAPIGGRVLRTTVRLQARRRAITCAARSLGAQPVEPDPRGQGGRGRPWRRLSGRGPARR